jgi:AraC-like DNA-binding protein
MEEVMQYLFEYSDILNTPYEAFNFDISKEVFPVRPHWHYFMEIIFIKKGSVCITCEERNYTLYEGDLIIFHPKAIHSIFSNNSDAEYSVIKFDINKVNVTNSYNPKLKTIFNNAFKNTKLPIFFKKENFKIVNLPHLFENCISELNKRNYGYYLIINSFLCSLLVEIVRLWKKEGFDTESLDVDDNSFNTVTEYIDEHSHELLKVQDIAAKYNMSYSYFAKNFKQLYGRSCKDYIEFIRICKVEDFLLFTDFDLNYISQETGFSDCSHLIKTFKKLRGITPKQFRIKHSNL